MIGANEGEIDTPCQEGTCSCNLKGSSNCGALVGADASISDVGGHFPGTGKVTEPKTGEKGDLPNAAKEQLPSQKEVVGTVGDAQLSPISAAIDNLLKYKPPPRPGLPLVPVDEKRAELLAFLDSESPLDLPEDFY